MLEAIKELVNDANFDCSSTGFSLHAMDSSHVALVALLLRSEGFDHYRCDRNLTMGMNLNNMAKMLKWAENDGIITIKADDGSDTITFMFESPNHMKSLVARKLLTTSIFCRECLLQLLEAAWCLTNIAAGNPEETKALLLTLPLLIAHLGEKSSSPIAEQYAWALGNVAGEDEELRNILLIQGALIPLAIMMLPNRRSTVRTAAWALSNLINVSEEV